MGLPVVAILHDSNGMQVVDIIFINNVTWRVIYYK
jgi:hypothetical protein